MQGFLLSEPGYTVAIEYSAAGNPIYVGEAEPGVATSVAKWRIKRLTYDANNNPTSIQWADGNNGFRFVWDMRLTYTFS